jgi:hypothetical protein
MGLWLLWRLMEVFWRVWYGLPPLLPLPLRCLNFPRPHTSCRFGSLRSSPVPALAQAMGQCRFGSSPPPRHTGSCGPRVVVGSWYPPRLPTPSSGSEEVLFLPGLRSSTGPTRPLRLLRAVDWFFPSIARSPMPVSRGLPGSSARSGSQPRPPTRLFREPSLRFSPPDPTLGRTILFGLGGSVLFPLVPPMPLALDLHGGGGLAGLAPTTSPAFPRLRPPGTGPSFPPDCTLWIVPLSSLPGLAATLPILEFFPRGSGPHCHVGFGIPISSRFRSGGPAISHFFRFPLV